MMNDTVDQKFVQCSLVFACVGFFQMLTAILGCGHMHPIAEHEHPHEHDHHHTHQHDHTHAPLEEVLHGELTGTYRLESAVRVKQNEGVEQPSDRVTGRVRGELKITPDYKFVISAEVEYNPSNPFDAPIDPEWWEWGSLLSWVPGTYYYSILPDSPKLALFYTAGHRFYSKAAYALEYEWDGKVLTLTHFDLRGDYSSDNVTMRWRKL